MKPTFAPAILLLVASCCPAPKIIDADVGVPAFVATSLPAPSPSPQHVLAEKPATPRADHDSQIVSIRKELDEVRAELKELAPYGGFRCYSGVDDPTSELVLTDEEKEGLRKLGKDLDAIIREVNSDTQKRARWKELTKIESELACIVEAHEISSRQAPALNPSGQR